MTINEQNKLILSAVAWTVDAVAEIEKAGGLGSVIIEKLPPEVIATMIRNNLKIKWDAKSNG